MDLNVILLLCVLIIDNAALIYLYKTIAFLHTQMNTMHSFDKIQAELNVDIFKRIDALAKNQEENDGD